MLTKNMLIASEMPTNDKVHKVPPQCIYGRRVGQTKRNHLGSASFHWLKFMPKKHFRTGLKRSNAALLLKENISRD